MHWHCRVAYCDARRCERSTERTGCTVLRRAAVLTSAPAGLYCAQRGQRRQQTADSRQTEVEQQSSSYEPWCRFLLPPHCCACCRACDSSAADVTTNALPAVAQPLTAIWLHHSCPVDENTSRRRSSSSHLPRQQPPSGPPGSDGSMALGRFASLLCTTPLRGR